MGATDVALYYDPYDPVIDADPHPVWRRLRNEAPLYYNERHDFYALSRFDDVLAASADWRTYSSARGTVLETMDTTPIAEGQTAGDGLGILIFTDPPRHDEMRRLVSSAFTPRRVAMLEGRIRDLCVRFLDPHVGGAGFDYVEDFAAKIPTMTIGALLGVPEPDQDSLRVWGDIVLHHVDGGPTREQVEIARQLHAYMKDMVADRKQRPCDDMVTDLLAAEIARDDGSRRRLDDKEVLAFFNLLQLAGAETTARLLGWAGVLLARHPDQRARLVAEPGMVPNAVEELLRYEAPSPIQGRFVTADVQWHGRTVPRNSKLALLTGSAGRDERRYPDPDRFDVGRDVDRHLTFGYGVHYCLGANLARLEARVALEETLLRFPEWTVEEADVEMARTTTVRGPVRVPIRL